MGRRPSTDHARAGRDVLVHGGVRHAPGQSVRATASWQHVRAQALPTIEPQVLSFLMDTSVLDSLSGTTCDAVLRPSGCAELLEQLAATRRLFLAPADGDRHICHVHRLFADLVRDELHRCSPDRFAQLHLAMSAWCEDEGDIDGAIRHAVKAQASDHTGDLVLVNATDLRAEGCT